MALTPTRGETAVARPKTLNERGKDNENCRDERGGGNDRSTNSVTDHIECYKLAAGLPWTYCIMKASSLRTLILDQSRPVQPSTSPAHARAAVGSSHHRRNQKAPTICATVSKLEWYYEKYDANDLPVDTPNRATKIMATLSVGM